MVEVRDRYEAYYADKLWDLLPTIYRMEDTYAFDQKGPLREMVDRIGAQAAVLRRGMDRLWEDQSIETCDDWVIPYIADLLATNLVASLDGRGQRLDAAKTIYYRRRKGTVSVLEELAADITGWQARVVEFCRRLGRPRHNLDPEIGLPSASDDPVGARALQLAEGLVGPLTDTAIGGWADLRDAYGATRSRSAFDEFFHTADMRRGRGMVGWHNIPRLGVFLWRLYSFPVMGGTPVKVDGCPGQFTFDPTGREVPLFARTRGSDAYRDAWVSPEEWQLPTPISKPLLDAILALRSATPEARPYPNQNASLYPESLAVLAQAGSFYDPVPPNTLTIWPERGRFALDSSVESPDLRASYHYGFSSTIGAGAYDRRGPGEAPRPEPVQTVRGGGSELVAPLSSLAGSGTVSIEDSLTYGQVSDVGGGTPIRAATIRAANRQRPVIRVEGTSEWRLTGQADATLTLEGLFLSGCDLVLSGGFDTVRLRCCTFDPGNAGKLSDIFAQASDGRDLVPSRIQVEGGTVRHLEIERCVTGPIRTLANGSIERLTISDSVVQAIRTSAPDRRFDEADLKDAARLAIRLRDRNDPLSSYIYGRSPASTRQRLNNYSGAAEPSLTLRRAIASGLNRLLAVPDLYDQRRFGSRRISPAAWRPYAGRPRGDELLRLNRRLLERAYPAELADGAIAVHEGEARLERCTLLGPANLHRLEASECVLDDVVQVEDAQHGCVRFSAWSTGSVLPRQYESVEISPEWPIFTTREFGQPGYAQLLTSVDTAIISGATISEGAENGSQMGAFARELHPIKERSLRIKYDEFMPVGLVPVIIYVT